MFNNVNLSEARNFTKCSFHLVLLFSEFYVPRKCHPKKRIKVEVEKQRKLDFFFSSSSASGKIMFNGINNRLAFWASAFRF